MKKGFTICLLIYCTLLVGCNDFAPFETTPTLETDSTFMNVAPPKNVESKEEEPTINVEPTLIRPQLFLMMKDAANQKKEADLKEKLLFQNLNFILSKYNLQQEGAPIVWRTESPNYFTVEAGVLIAKKLPKGEVGTYYKQTKRGKAVVAHFFGKRSLLPKAYHAIDEWLKENHQKRKGNFWLKYESSAQNVIDKTFLQTDVFCETL